MSLSLIVIVVLAATVAFWVTRSHLKKSESSVRTNRWGTQGRTVLSQNMETEILALIQKNQKIEAIKRVREHTGWGLKEAKDYVDHLESSR